MPAPATDFERLRAAIAQIDDPVELMEQSYAALSQILPHTNERELLDQISILLGEVVGSLPFDASEKELRHQTRLAAADCIAILEAARDRRLPSLERDPFLREQAAARLEEDFPPPPASSGTEQAGDLEYSLPPHLAHLLRHMDYPQPEPAAPRGGFADFDELCLAALHHRLDRVLAFFQKHNPAVARPLPVPFLQSPRYAERYRKAVAKLIYPRIRDSRQVRLLASNVDVRTSTTESFWEAINGSMARLLELSWQNAWDDLLLVPEQRGTERIMKIRPETRELRALLQPDTPEAYDLPHLGNREILLLASLLSAGEDWWPRLARFWHACHTLYEQEWDPRVFQQQAREGALRDLVLKGLAEFPEPWHDFFVLMLHRVFPRLGTRFLERFAYNLGQTDEARRARMPFLMRYVDQARARPDVREQEQREEDLWRRQVKALADWMKGVSFPTAASMGPS